jgi:hypothetical protein
LGALRLSGRCIKGQWPEFSNPFDESIHHRSESRGFTGRDPFETNPFLAYTENLDDSFQLVELLDGAFVSGKVMAVTRVASGDQDAIGALLEGVQHEGGIHTSRAHGAEDPKIGRLSDAGDSRRVRTGVTTPVACKEHDAGAERLAHDFETPTSRSASRLASI